MGEKRIVGPEQNAILQGALDVAYEIGSEPARRPARQVDPRVGLVQRDRELFVLNSFYRDGAFVPEKLQGLWIGDADYVRLQLEAMVRGLSTGGRRPLRVLPRNRVRARGSSEHGAR